MNKKSFNSSLLAAVLAPFFIALGIMLIKLACNNTPALVVAGLGSLMAVPILYLVSVTTKQKLLIKDLLTKQRKAFLQVLITRAIFGQMLITAGFALTTGVKSVLLLRLEPVFVLIWSIFLKGEKPSKAKLGLITMLIIGSALVVAPNNALSAPNIGDLLIILSLLFLSYSYMPTEIVVKQSSAQGLNFLTTFISGIVITIISIFIYPNAFSSITTKSLELIFGYSFVFFIIAASLYFYAFKTAKPWVIASLLSLEVVYGIILAYFMLQETMTINQIIGSIIILASTVLIGKYYQ